MKDAIEKLDNINWIFLIVGLIGGGIWTITSLFSGNIVGIAMGAVSIMSTLLVYRFIDLFSTHVEKSHESRS